MLTRRTLLSGVPLALSAATARRLTNEEDRFLEDLSHRSFRFFWEQSDPGTGLARDRALADTETPDKRLTASSASTGFGLTGLCIAAERGWLPRTQARDRVIATLRYYADKALQEHGWFYHFVDCTTGARRGTTEVSDIDTALLLAGVVTIFSRAKDVVPMDRIKALHIRGILLARQGAWRESEQELSEALAMADREPWVDPRALRSLLVAYAYVLRRNRHGRVARSIEARASGIHRQPSAVVDVTELLAKPGPAKK